MLSVLQGLHNAQISISFLPRHRFFNTWNIVSLSASAASFLELEPNEPNFNKVGTVLATECQLLLVPEC